MSPFGGVKQDVYCIKQAANGESGSRTQPKSASEQHPQVARMLFYAADLPFTLIGDAVTWPYTATYTYINQPIPNPPIILAPPVTQVPPVTQATAEGRPSTSP